MATGVIKAVPTIAEVNGKADKVANATNGHLAALDTNGNLTDSGYSASDFSASNTGNTLSWGSAVSIATVSGTNITAKLPSNPNSWRGYQVKAYTYAWSNLAADGTLEVTGNQFKDSNNAVVSTPSGYTPVAVLEANTGHTQVQLVSFRGNATGTNWLLRGRNNSTGTKSGTASIRILYLQT